MVVKKSEDFGEWYNEIVELAGLTDKRYPIKGMNVWTPYGWKIMRMTDEFIREELDATNHQEVCFPLLIPETEFRKEKDHIKGFDSEVYWVTHAGLNELDIRMCLRPTSETAMYPIFALWIRSHSDLPLKTYQIVNTFRYETKMTRAFIRVREIHFFESHTCHTTDEDAQRQVEEDFAILEKVMKHLALPYFLLTRTEWDKFPGAYYTVGVDCPLLEGRSLQLGSIHHYRDNFAKPFEIKFEDVDGTLKYVHQTTYGMSERLVGCTVAFHGDDKGLVLPPDVAPIQVVIIPILAKGKVEEVLAEAQRLRDELKGAGFRVHLDDKDERPGSKFFNWEIKGVPLRLELGQRDMSEGKVSFAIRHDGSKGSFLRTTVVDDVRSKLQDIMKVMNENAWRRLSTAVATIDSLDNLPKKILRFGWCGSEECGREIETQSELKILGAPFVKEEFQGKCLVCGKETEKPTYAARAM